MEQIWLYVTGTVVIAILVLTAAYYQWRLYQLKRELRRQQQQAEEAARKHREGIYQSMQIICRATVAGQVGQVEASIRLSVLMDQLGLEGADRQEFAVFDKMAAAVRHIPILDAWKQLPKREKQKFEREMERHEAELGDFITAAARNMIGKNWS